MKHVAIATVLIITVGLISTAIAAGPPEANIRNAYKMILSNADANKDGKLSSTEFMSMYKDKNMAKKNFSFWDINKDGYLTEEEYVKRGSNVGK